jgi:TM2 domain-containing membrane protein YozV
VAESFCERCGTPGSGQFCAKCGQPRGGAAAVAVAPAYDPMTAHVNDAVTRARMRHSAPAILSFFIPGLGQLIKGEVLKAIGVFFVSVFCWLLCFVYIGFVLGPLFWVIQIYDAYTSPDARTKEDLKLIERVKRQSRAAQ